MGESFYKALVEASPDAIMFSDLFGTISLANERSVEMGGFTHAGELIGQNLFRFIVKPDPETMAAQFRKLIEGMNKGTLEAVISRKDGSLYDAEVTGAVLSDEQNRPVGLITITRDISDRKSMERTLQMAKTEAEKANHLKDAFISNISHEIRTPLNSILGFSDLIRLEAEGKLPEKSKRYFKVIEESCNQLLHTVESMLDISRLQTGMFSPQRTLLDTEKLIRKLVEDFMAPAAKKGLKLEYINEAGPVILSTDSFCLTQPLTTMIGNAIKYTDKGHVKVTTSRYFDNVLKIKIEDTGLGMSQDYMNRLYEPFAKEETDTNRKFRGLGLSLSISKRLLASIGASISVTSTPGKGTCFTIIIPIA
jgi:PAS domain S-box-containing protein